VWWKMCIELGVVRGKVEKELVRKRVKWTGGCLGGMRELRERAQVMRRHGGEGEGRCVSWCSARLGAERDKSGTVVENCVLSLRRDHRQGATEGGTHEPRVDVARGLLGVGCTAMARWRERTASWLVGSRECAEFPARHPNE